MLGSSAHVGSGLDTVVIVAPKEVVLTAAKKKQEILRLGPLKTY